MLDKTSSIICAFGLASAAPRSPYRHLELCGVALRVLILTTAAAFAKKAAAGLLSEFSVMALGNVLLFRGAVNILDFCIYDFSASEIAVSSTRLSRYSVRSRSMAMIGRKAIRCW